LIDRVNPARIFRSITDLPESIAFVASFSETLTKLLNVMMELLFKAHRQMFSFVNITYAGFSMLLLGISLRQELTPRVRRQMRVVITGLGLCILTYSLAWVLPIFSNLELSHELSTGFINASLILGGGSIALAIVRYQFLDMRLIARKGIFYAAAVAIFASVYLLTIKQITSFLRQFSGIQVEILETGLIILFIIVFQPVFARLEEWADKLMVREESKPRVRVRDLSVELLSMIDIDHMKERIINVLADVFDAREVGFIFTDDVLALKDRDIYAEKVVQVLSQAGEPIVRLDFMEAMGFLNLGGRRFLRPSRKIINEAVETLPGIVRTFARYELTVPIMHDEKCLAVLLLGSKREQTRYSSQEQALLSMLASQISASLSRIELLEQVVEKKIMEEELNIARAIQLNLLPASPPRLDNYEAAALSLASKQVGGDYYDFVHRDSLLAFAVADVSGKGVPASLLMASLQASLRANMDRMEHPVEVVSRLNEAMCETTAADKFATLYYGCINLKKHDLVYTNAGHFFPVVVRRSGDIDVLDYSGLILGVMPDYVYENRKLKMGPGDTLVVTTDGVTEAEGRSGDLYGEERLYGLLSTLKGRGAEEIRDAIVKDVNDYSYPKGANDDLTILVLKRKD
jgi:sigma-B regulation protein RsbU (phosphoserine phosphatase)